MTQVENPEWLLKHQADTELRDKRLRRRQVTQVITCLHITIIIGMLVAGIVIIIGLLTNPTPAVRLDMHNFTNYAKIYIVVFVVNTAMFLAYTLTANNGTSPLADE